MILDPLSRIFSALAHPARRAMLARLNSGEASVQELAKPFKMSAPAVSKHLKVLEQAGLISRGRDAQWRPCRLEIKPIQAVSEWMDQYRTQWDQSMDRLESYLQTLQPPVATASPATPQPPRGGRRPSKRKRKI